MNQLDMRDKAEILKLLGHPTRLLILEELAKGAKCELISRIYWTLNSPTSLNIFQYCEGSR